jgi:membrane protein
VLLRAFATNQDIEQVLSRAFEYAGVNQIAVPDEAPPPVPKWNFVGGLPVAIPTAPTPVAVAPPEAKPARLDAFIRDLVKRVSEIPFASIGWIGLAMLIYASISMLVELERSFNQIYRVPVGRSWARRITQYWTVLTLGTGCLAATFFVGEQFKTWAAKITEAQGLGGGGVTVTVIGFMVTVVISTGLFLLAYTCIPNTRVSLRAAIVGAVVAALCWETGKWGFTQYVRMSAATSYGRLYGSMALVPLFLLWIYLTWLIALFGLQVAYHIQHVRKQTIAQPREAAEPTIVDPAAILSVAVALAERFEKGQSADAPEIAEQLHIQRPIAKQMLDRLAEGGLVHRLVQATNDDEHERFALARPPSTIMAEEVLELGRGLESGITEDAAGRLTETIRQCRVDALRGKDVATLAGLNGQAPAATVPASPATTPAPPTPPANTLPA